MEYKYKVLRTERSRNKNDLPVTLLCCFFLLMLGFIIYRPDSLLGLFSDDQGLVDSLVHSHWNEFIFANSGAKFRPVFSLVTAVLWRISGCSTVNFIKMLPFLNIFLAITLFFLADYLFKNRLLSIAIGSIYIVSRFAYYQTMMLHGIMEGTALFFAIACMFFAMDYVINNNNKSIWFAVISYVLSVFSHERYLTLIVILLAATWLQSGNENNRPISKKKRIIYSAIILSIFILILLLRQLLFKDNAWEGTGGVDMRSSFSLQTILSFVWKQIMYLFGWGASETYLSGYGYKQMNISVTVSTVIFDVLILLLFIIFIKTYISDKEHNKTRIIKGLIIIILFIGACIISSSTTIRVEMRWLYVSQVALLIGVGLLGTYIFQHSSNVLRTTAVIATSLALITSFYIEINYRQGWKNIYYYKTLAEDNSLMEIVQNYSDINNLNLIIIDKNDPDKTYNAEKLLRQMDVKRKYMPNSITLYKSIYQYQDKQTSQDLVVEKRNGLYRDITGIFDSTDAQSVISGIRYGDGWATNDVEIEVIPFKSNQYQIVLYTNDDISQCPEDERTVYISINGKEYGKFVFEGYYEMNCELEINKPNIIKVKSNLTAPHTERDGNNLAYTLFINGIR